MKTALLLITFQLLATITLAQSDAELALKKGQEAIGLMDSGKIDESIKLLKESQKLDPDNYMYPYEIAYAYVLREEYKKAIKILDKVKDYKVLNSQVYQMSGNCYSFLGKRNEAIKEYEEGMRRFPNAGNLHLEKGNIFLAEANYTDAIKNYEKGIEVDPMFASNYFRLAKLFLSTNDKLSGLIYGEIFMNLERTTGRTKEMSELLYETYTSSITIGEDESKIDFCEVIIDASEIDPEGELRLPLCAIFGKNFALSIIGTSEVDLSSLSKMRTQFLRLYFKEDHENYPNVLFEYQKELLDKDIFDAYNHYLFQMGAENEFDEWLKSNQKTYDDFVDWYVKEENVIEIRTGNRFVRD